jgi:hypothetical protein
MSQSTVTAISITRTVESAKEGSVIDGRCDSTPEVHGGRVVRWPIKLIANQPIASPPCPRGPVLAGTTMDSRATTT